MRTLLTIFSSLVLLMGSVFNYAGAEEKYPNTNIDIILPFNAGGGTDNAMRLLQKYLEPALGARLNFLYKAGASGALGYIALSKAEGDGYTIGAINWPHVLVPAIIKDNPGYKLTDIEPVAAFDKDVAVLAVHKDSEWKTLQDFVEDLKNRPEKISLGHPNRLGYSIKAAYEFEEATGAKPKHVFFDGGAATQQAFLGKHVDAIIHNASVVRKMKDEARVLGVLGKERVGVFPEAPTFAEAGFAEIEVYTYRAIAVPAGVNPEHKAILARAIEKAVSDPEYIAEAEKMGLGPNFMDTAELQEFSAKTYKRIEELYTKYEKSVSK